MSFPKQIQDKLDRGTGCFSGIGEGWMPLVVDLDEKLSKSNPDYRIDQIKSKFGQLCYYADYRDFEDRDKVIALVSEFERKSLTICEVCGKAGELRKSRWWRTLCDEHVKRIDQ